MLVDDAVALVPSIPGRRALLGLAGAPAAGKSTLARRLVAGVNDRLGEGTAAYVPMDGFHLSNAQLDRLRLRDHKGAPETFDVDGYVVLLRRLRTERSSPSTRRTSTGGSTSPSRRGSSSRPARRSW